VSDEPSPLDGVRLFPLQANRDERGAFSELFRASWIEGPQMLQMNLSRSRAGVLRGLHFHREQADYWVLLSGVEFVGLYDLRAGSPTEGRKLELRLDAEERQGLYIPPGVAHGFYAETDLELLYLVDRYFTGEDEFGVAWNDPEIGIAWPSADPILSERDRTNPSLSEVLRPEVQP
jgi:dTDP-4-dehydrorhamnose 3,5-epimerase